jgi:hypothetical protein
MGTLRNFAERQRMQTLVPGKGPGWGYRVPELTGGDLIAQRI